MEVVDEFGDCPCSHNPRNRHRLSFGYKYTTTTTTWLITMTSPASQPRFDSHTATLSRNPLAGRSSRSCIPPRNWAWTFQRVSRLCNPQSPDLQPFFAAENSDPKTARLYGSANPSVLVVGLMVLCDRGMSRASLPQQEPLSVPLLPAGQQPDVVVSRGRHILFSIIRVPFTGIHLPGHNSSLIHLHSYTPLVLGWPRDRWV